MCAFSDANTPKDAMTVDAKTPKSTVFTTPGDEDTKTFLVVRVVLGDEDMMMNE